MNIITHQKGIGGILLYTLYELLYYGYEREIEIEV